MDCFATSVALRERKSISDRLTVLGLERVSTWRDREIRELRTHLLEVDGAIAHHRAVARQRGH